MTVKAVILALDGVVFCDSVADYERSCRQMETNFVEADLARANRVATEALVSPERTPIMSNHALLQAVTRRELDISAVALEQKSTTFYTEAFPSLRELSQVARAFAPLFTELRERNLLCGLLTDVRFPGHAAHRRLEWASMACENWGFIAHSETVHFAATDTALFAEIVARLGVEPDEALFVGAEAAQLAAARRAGLCVFAVNGVPQTTADCCLDGAGSLDTLLKRIRAGWLRELTPRPLTREQVLAELRGNIGALYGLLAEVKDQQWHMRPEPAEWTIVQILCHLLERETEEQLPRIQRIVAEDSPFIVAPMPTSASIEPCSESGWQVAESFAAARARTLSYLGELAVMDWQRSARHSIFGPTTLIEMAHFTAQHDRLHLNQLCQTLGKCE